MNEHSEREMSSLEAQLVCLYADRERLELELGTADAEPILKHIRSLEERLRDAEDSIRDPKPALPERSGDGEAEMRLAEVVSERESFFENVQANSYPEVETHISELKEQLETMEHQMKSMEAEAETSSSVEPAAPFGGTAPSEQATPTAGSATGSGAQAAKDVQAFAEGLAGLYKKSEVVFEGELASGRFRFTASNDTTSNG